MNKYNDSKIYKIVDNTSDKVYIGSTCCKYLSQRLQKHVHTYKQYLKNNYHRVSSFDIIENGNYDIILLENVNCETIDQLRARERFYIQSNVCVNQHIPTRTDKEYYDDNKERIKEYYENNKERILQRHKVFREANKESKSKRDKEYRLNNKEKIKEHATQPYECECGSIIRHCKKSIHFKSIKHLNFISNK